MKILSIAVSALVAAGLLAGCGPKTPEAGLTQDEQAAPAGLHSTDKNRPEGQGASEPATVESAESPEEQATLAERESGLAQQTEQDLDQPREEPGQTAQQAPSAEQTADAVTAEATMMCPAMPGRPVDPNLFVEYGGKRIYVCCRKCLKHVGEDPAAWYAKVYGSG